MYDLIFLRFETTLRDKFDFVFYVNMTRISRDDEY